MSASESSCAPLASVRPAGRVAPDRGAVATMSRMLRPMSGTWDAATYDRIADPMARWGGRVLDWLELRGDERVLDAGCGSGRVTEQLLERLPAGRVVALDASQAMVEQARQRLARFGDRVEFVVSDLAAGIPIQGQVDAILSTATLHWIADHDAVFRN